MSTQSWGITIDDSGDLDFRVNAGGTWDRVIVSGVVETGEWQNIVATYDGTDMQLYLNGTLVGTQAHSVGGDLSEGAGDTITIGDSPVGGREVDGLIDDARVYDYVLSDAEIAELYGLIGHWKLDEASGTVATDSTAIGNDGGYWNGAAPGGNGPYPTVGADAAEVDSSDAHIGMYAHSSYENISETITLAAWVYFDTAIADQTAQEYPIGRSDWGSQSGFSLHVDQPYADALKFRLFNGTTYADASWNNSGIEAGEWHHVVGTYDGTTMSLYVDGELKDTTTFAGPLVPYTGANLNLGWGQIGRLFDVRLYNRRVTEKEIADMYGLIGHWRMDEGSGSTAADSTGYGNDATLSGATWTSTCTGKYALEFDGAGGTAATGSNFDPPAQGTVAYWFRSDGTPASRQRPWGNGGNFEMWYDTDGLMSFDIATDGYQGGFITTTPVDTANRWYHLVGVYDSADESYSIYINGRLHKSGISTWAINDEAANILTFGTRTGNTQYFDGAIRDFRVYNRPLSNDEIAELSGMIAHWQLNETSGSVADDAGVAANDATYISSPGLGANGPYPAASPALPSISMAVRSTSLRVRACSIISPNLPSWAGCGLMSSCNSRPIILWPERSHRIVASVLLPPTKSSSTRLSWRNH